MYNYRKAMYKNIKFIKAQFNLVQAIKDKYYILNTIMYNFNKTSNSIGVIEICKVITALNSLRKF